MSVYEELDRVFKGGNLEHAERLMGHVRTLEDLITTIDSDYEAIGSRLPERIYKSMQRAVDDLYQQSRRYRKRDLG